MPAGAELMVRVQPRASRSELLGWEDGVLRMRLTAPPVDGAANRACREFLAMTLGFRRADVRLVAGEKSRVKRFHFEGVSAEELRARVDRRLAEHGRR